MATQVEELVYRLSITNTDQSNKSIQELIASQRELAKLLKSLPAEGTAAYNTLEKELQEATGSTESLTQSQKRLTQQYSEGKAKITDFNRSLRQGNAAVGSINNLRNRVIALNRELDNTAITINGKANPAYEKLSAESAQLTQQLKNAEAESKRFQRNVGNYPKLGDAVADSFQRVGEILLATFTIPNLINKVKEGFREVLNIGTEFGRIESILKGLNEGADISRLIAQAEELGATTEKTASEVGQLQIKLTRLGFSQDEIIEATEGILNLSTAAGEDLARSAEVAGSTLRAYGLEASQTTSIVDLMAKSFATTALDLNKFAEAQKLVGPVARQLNFDIADTTALLGTLANAGISGSQAGTALRNSLLKVADPASKLNKELRTLDKSFEDGVNNSEEYIKALQLLNDKGLELGDILEVSDRRSVAAFATLLSGSEDVNTLAESFREADGAGAQMAETIRDDVQGDLDILASTTEGLALNLFDQLEPAIRVVIQATTEFVGFLSQLVTVMTKVPVLTTFIVTALTAYAAILVVTKVQIAGVTIAELAKRAATLAGAAATGIAQIATAAYNVVLALFTGGTTAAAAATAVFNTVLAANPIGAVALGIAAAAAATVALVRAFSDTSEETERLRASTERAERAYAKATEEIGKQVSASNILFEALKEAKAEVDKGALSQGEYQKVLDEVNETYGDYLPFLLDQKTSLDDIETAQRKVNKALEDSLILEFRQQAIRDILGESLKEQLDLIDSVGFETEKSAVEIRQIAKDVNDYQKSLEDLAEGYGQTLDVSKGFAEGLQEVTGSLDSFRAEQFNKQVKELAANLSEAQKESLKFASSLSATSDAGNLTELLFGQQGDLQYFQRVLDSVKGTDEALQSVYDVFGQGTGILAENLRLTEETNEEGKLSEQGLERRRGAYEKLIQEIDRLNKSTQKQIDLANLELAGGKDTIEGLRELQRQKERDLEKSFELLDKEAEALTRKGVSEEKILTISENRKNALREALAQETDDKINAIIEKRSKNEQKAIEEAVIETIAVIEETEAKKTLEVERAYAERIRVVQQLEVDNEQQIQERSKRLQDLEREQQKEILLIQIQAIQQQLKVADLASRDRINLETSLLDKQRALSNAEVEVVRSAEERKQDLINQTQDLQSQALQQLASTINQIGGLVKDNIQSELALLNERGQARDSELEDEINRLERIRLERIKDIEQSNLSEDAKKAAIAAEKKRNQGRIADLKLTRKEEARIREEAQIKLEARQKRAIEFDKKVAAAQQAIASAKIAINAAETLSNNIKAVSNGAAIPFPGNIAAIVTIIAAIASGIASITQLTRGSQVQRLETGGYINPLTGNVMYATGGQTPNEGVSPTRRIKGRGGMHYGPRHSGGGKIIEVEGGEFEVNREATKMFLPELVWMNNQGLRKMRGKGVQGRLKSPDTTTSGLGLKTIIKAVKVPMPNRVFQTGGLVTDSRSLSDFAGFLVGLTNKLETGFNKLEVGISQVAQTNIDRKVTLSLIELEDEQAFKKVVVDQSEV